MIKFQIVRPNNSSDSEKRLEPMLLSSIWLCAQDSEELRKLATRKPAFEED
jgi:hypothetical protein